MQTVHVRVVDAATGMPTPCRVRFTDESGGYFAPFGRRTDFAAEDRDEGNVFVGPRRYALIDGSCEIALPAGAVRVEIHKGPEYTPVDETVVLAPGKLALRFSLTRWADLAQDGWRSGDVDVAGLSPHGALLEGAAEDVAVVDLLIREEAGAIDNILAFSGREPALERPGRLVAVNTLNQHSVLGRLALLYCHRVVYPLTFGGPDGADDWTLADWCDQCHRKNGLVVGCSFFDGEEHGELLADVLLGKVDALQLDAGFHHPDLERMLDRWHALLDLGLRMPLVGGSGKRDNSTVIGRQRTCAKLGPGEALTYATWTEAVRAGRTFVSNGPLLRFAVNGGEAGTTLDLDPEATSLQVQAEARSLLPFEKLEVVQNGAVVASAAAAGGPIFSATVDATIDAGDGGWLAARCYGNFDDDRQDWIGAQTSPVYVHRSGRPRSRPTSAWAKFRVDLEKGLAWVDNEARCPDESSRGRLRAVFTAALEELRRRTDT